MRRLMGVITAIVLVSTSAFAVASAASTVVVTSAHTQGWVTADTRPGGDVQFVKDSTAPSGNGALQLTTDSTTAAKAQYMHGAETPLANVDNLSYYTKQISATFAGGLPSYQLAVYLTGDTSGFTTLVFEPYWNTSQGAVMNGVWQSWDVDSGIFWSSRTVECSGGAVTGAAGGPATYTLSQISALCPDAIVAGFGVNVGTYNPGYTVETDLVAFNGTTYDFEATNEPSSQDACKNGGWQSMTDAQGHAFKNQGDCVSYVATNGRNPAAGNSGNGQGNGR